MSEQEDQPQIENITQNRINTLDAARAHLKQLSLELRHIYCYRAARLWTPALHGSDIKKDAGYPKVVKALGTTPDDLVYPHDHQRKHNKDFQMRYAPKNFSTKFPLKSSFNFNLITN